MKQLLNWMNEAETIVLLPHLHADGDALGSCFALAELIKGLGKTPLVILEEEPQAKFDFLNGEFQVFNGIVPEYDLVIAVDCSSLDRLGARQELFQGKTACIDHHITDHPIGDLSYVQPDAAATAELVYEFALLTGQMNIKIGTCIYTALCTDSGTFRYSSTTSKTMRIGADLIEAGVDAAFINRQLYEQISLGNLYFQGECIRNMQLHADGKIAATYLTKEKSDELGLTSDDTDVGGSIMLSVKGVHAGAFFHERTPGLFKVSLRSDEQIDVAEIAKYFGGGGHLRASGYTTDQPIDIAINELVVKLKEQLVE